MEQLIKKVRKEDRGFVKTILQKITAEESEKIKDAEKENILKQIERITKKTEMIPVFADKLKTIKNNPIDEVKIAKKQKELNENPKSKPEMLLDIVEAVYSIEEIEQLEEEYKIKLEDIIHFGGAVTNKVFGLKEIVDGEEVFKEPESHAKLKPVPYSKKREIRDQFEKLNKVSQKLLQKEDVENEDEVMEEFEKQQKLFNIKINNAHNLDTSDMTDWEKELLHQKVLANAFGGYTPPLGKK